jgi:hypothetical protein
MPNDPNGSQEEHARTGWRGRVLNEARRMEAQLGTCVSDPPVAAAIAEFIEEARAAAVARDGGMRDWFTGVSFERAWSALHAADELMAECAPSRTLKASTADLLADLEARLSREDTRLAGFRKLLDTCAQPDPKELSDAQRADIRAARHTANTANFVSQGVVRRWRNLLLAVGAAVLIVAVVLAIVDAAVDFLPLADKKGSAVEAWQVELIGAFGGAIGAVLAINRFSGYTDPNGLPLYQALLRIPMAAAISLLGVVLMQSGIVNALTPQPSGSVLAYAVLFGYAQEPLLRTIDRKAGEVLGPARGKDDPVTHPATPADK